MGRQCAQVLASAQPAAGLKAQWATHGDFMKRFYTSSIFIFDLEEDERIHVNCPHQAPLERSNGSELKEGAWIFAHSTRSL